MYPGRGSGHLRLGIVGNGVRSVIICSGLGDLHEDRDSERVG